MPFPRIESFGPYINFLKRKVTNVAILSNIYLEITKVMIVCYIFLKKIFFNAIVKNRSCAFFGQTSHCGGGGATVNRIVANSC